MWNFQVQATLISASFLAAQALNGLVVNSMLWVWFFPILAVLEVGTFLFFQQVSRDVAKAKAEFRKKQDVPLEYAKATVSAKLLEAPTTTLVRNPSSMDIRSDLPATLHDFFTVFESVSIDGVEIAAGLVGESSWRPGYIKLGSIDNDGMEIIARPNDDRVWAVDSSTSEDDLPDEAYSSIWHFLLNSVESLD